MNNFEKTITLAEFEELCAGIWERCKVPLQKAIEHEEADELTKVILVGGSSRIPAVRRLVQELCPNAELLYNIHVDEAIAIGASIMGGTLMGLVQQEQVLAPIEESKFEQSTASFYTMDDRMKITG